MGIARQRGGTTSQTLGGISFRSGKFNLNYQNDWPTGDGGDRYRTAALRLGWQDFSLGFNLYTGDPGLKDRTVKVVEGQHTYVKGPYGDPDKYRAGILYAGYGNYQYGANSEGIRHTIQNKWIHNLIGSPHFKVLNNNRQSYFRLGTSNPYTLW